MPDMKHSGNVGRGHHNAKVFAFLLDIFIAIDLEVAALLPNFIKALLYGFRVVKICHFQPFFKILNLAILAEFM